MTDWSPPPPPPDPNQPPPPPPYQPPPYQQQPPQQQPYGGYGYGYGYAAPPKTEGTAVGALVSAILAWTVCPVIPAVVALVLASSARQKIESSNGTLTGEGLVTAAKWVAIINLVMFGLMIVGFIFLIALGAVLDGGSSDFESEFQSILLRG